MESINPKNLIDIDPSIVSFITLKDGNMIMIDDSIPDKPNKVELFSNNGKNSLHPLNKEKTQELTLSEQIYFSFIGTRCQKTEEGFKTIIKKNDFNLISSISNNINFSFLNGDKINEQKNNIKNNNKNNYKSNLANLTSPNSSIDIKSSMFQGGKNNNNINNLNNNIISDDNVNIHLTDTYMSNPKNNYNGKNEEIMSKNIFENNTKNNNLRQINKIIKDTQKYTFDENANNENDNNNGNINNFNYNNQIEISSNITQNNNNNTNMAEQNRTKSEVVMSNTTQDNISTTTKKYSRLNRLRKKNKDNNYIKAVVSINIPAEEKETINLVKQFNSLVDRLNGQKSITKSKEITRRSDRYYELYKNQNENILNSLISPEKNNLNTRKTYNYFFDKKKKYMNNTNNSIYNNDNDNNTKNSNLNSRILALKERTFSSMNNSFLNENIKENYKSNNNNSEIVLPANFAFNK